MKEAFLDQEHWTEFQVELEVFDLHTALCQEMVSVHNEYIAQHLLLSKYAFQATTCELGNEIKLQRPIYVLSTINNMNVKQLQSELRVRGLSTTGQRSKLKSRLPRSKKTRLSFSRCDGQIFLRKKFYKVFSFFSFFFLLKETLLKPKFILQLFTRDCGKIPLGKKRSESFLSLSD